jgi:hypothetical protein
VEPRAPLRSKPTRERVADRAFRLPHRAAVSVKQSTPKKKFDERGSFSRHRKRSRWGPAESCIAPNPTF